MDWVTLLDTRSFLLSFPSTNCHRFLASDCHSYEIFGEHQVLWKNCNEEVKSLILIVPTEVIMFTETCFWAGTPVTPLRPGAVHSLEKCDRTRLAMHILYRIGSETVLLDVFQSQNNDLELTLWIDNRNDIQNTEILKLPYLLIFYNLSELREIFRASPSK